MENLGEKIKKQREAKNMSVEDLSKETFLSVAVINDIEAGKFDRYEGEETYVKMYLKKISDALDMNRDELTQSYIALTQEIKLSQLEDDQNKGNKKEEQVKKGKEFKFDTPHLARKKSVYEDKSHIKIIRVVIVVVLLALIVGIVWWGISTTKSKVDNPSFDTTDSTKVDGDVTDDKNNSNTTNNPSDNSNNTNENSNNSNSTQDVTFTKNSKLNYDFTLPDNSETFKFKIVFGNESWASLKVNDSDYSDFESRTYSKDETIELEFNVNDFNNLDLKNGYSMGHKYYINDVELPLTDDDSSESITHLILTLKK